MASTILIFASGVLTCAMRRTLVSRKERKRRIAENADMNGQNFYAAQNTVPQGIRADSPPPLSSTAVGPSEKLASFTTYEKKAPEEDRVPLNSRPSNRSLPGAPHDRGPPISDNSIGARARGAPMGMRGGRGGYSGPKDEYGNPLPPSNAFGPAPPMGIRRDRSEPPMKRQYSDESMNSYRARSGRGRGGYPPRGYGRGRPYGSGPGPGRGGFARGPMGPPPQRGPPPPGYGNDYYSQGRSAQYEGPGPAGYVRSPSAPGYGRRNHSPSPPLEMGGYDRRSPGPPSAPGRYERGPPRGPPSDPGGYTRGPPKGPPSDPGGYSTGRQDAYYEPANPPYRQASPPMPPPPPVRQPEEYGSIGQAVEMDARHGSPSNVARFNDSDSTVRGLVGLQQQNTHRDTPSSMTSIYSANE